MTIHLHNLDTGADLGEITAEQLEQMAELLEEEDEGKQNYWIDAEVVGYLEEEGVDPELCNTLKAAVEGQEGVEVQAREE
jgi:hypothetical protein